MDEIDHQLADRGYARVLVHKSRKEGISTFCQNLAVRYCTLNEYALAKTVAHEATATDELFKIGKTVADGLDPAIFPALLPPKARQLEWSNGSVSKCATQGGSADTDRGLTYDFLHLSEIPSWETRRQETSAKDVAQSLLNTVPLKTGIIIIESTSKGAHGLFYDMCMQAMNNVKGNDYKYMFFTWLDNKEYIWEASTPELIKEDEFNHLQLQKAAESKDPTLFNEICDFYEANALERERIQRFGLHPNQLRFWRFTVVNNCGSDQDRFDEEWPMSPELAFISGGSALFAATTVQRLRRDAKKGESGMMAGGQFSRGPGAWNRFQKPLSGHTYIVSSDSCAGGKGKRDDYASITVLDRVTSEEVASFYDKTPPDQLAHEMSEAAVYYNEALCAPEIEGPGLLTVHTLAKEHPERNIYRRFSEAGKVGVSGTRELGYSTNQKTRHYMFGLFESAVRTDRVKVNSLHLIEEMSHLRRNPRTNKPEAAPGYHDDATISMAIAIAVDQQMAEQGIPAEVEPTPLFERPPGIHEPFSGRDSHEQEEDTNFWF